MFFIYSNIKIRSGNIILIVETLSVFSDLLLLLYVKGFIHLTE